LVGTWLWIGFSVLVFVSGIRKIDVRIFDAASIDGANEIQQFFAITLPELRAEFVVVVVVTLIRAFGSNVFGIVSAITGGGYHTKPLSLMAYNLAFVEGRMGYGSAVVVFLIALIVLLSVLTFRAGEERRR
jgi:ABC-type sugar transport system permease subunit